MGPDKVSVTKKHVDAINQLIEHYGSQYKLASALGLMSANVYGWKTGRCVIPVKHAEKLEELTDRKFTVLQIRPDLLAYEKFFATF